MITSAAALSEWENRENTSMRRTFIAEIYFLSMPAPAARQIVFCRTWNVAGQVFHACSTFSAKWRKCSPSGNTAYSIHTSGPSRNGGAGRADVLLAVWDEFAVGEHRSVFEVVDAERDGLAVVDRAQVAGQLGAVLLRFVDRRPPPPAPPPKCSCRP